MVGMRAHHSSQAWKRLGGGRGRPGGQIVVRMAKGCLCKKYEKDKKENVGRMSEHLGREPRTMDESLRYRGARTPGYGRYLAMRELR